MYAEIMWPQKVYLGGPINGCNDVECKEWREHVKIFYPKAIDPMVRDYRGREAECFQEIVELDKEDIRNADVLLVSYSKPSVGTSMEIFYAWTLGKPIVLWCKEGENLSPWLLYHCTAIVHSLTDAMNKVRQV
jgi:nucleoside 2-deoxyribosyltransferase